MVYGLNRLGLAVAAIMVTALQAARADATNIDVPAPATLALLGAAVGGKFLIDIIRRR